jgi:5'(3')-deoxyribonucleotidase
MEKSRGGHNRMILVFDIDGVLNNLVEKTLDLYNSRSGKNVQISDIISYNFYDCLPREDADGIVSLFKEKSLWDSLKPLEGSQNGLKRLIKKGHQVYLATATDPINFEWKIAWLKQYFPFIPEDNVIRIIDKSLLKADILIDDCLDNLISSSAERITLNYPWNHNELKDYAYSIRRAYSWSDINNIINDIDKEMKKWER